MLMSPHRPLLTRLRSRVNLHKDRALSFLLDALDRVAGNGFAPSQPVPAPPPPGLRSPFAIIGCWFVADFYARTLPQHPELELAGVVDRDPARAKRFAEKHQIKTYA